MFWIVSDSAAKSTAKLAVLPPEPSIQSTVLLPALIVVKKSLKVSVPALPLVTVPARTSVIACPREE